MNLQKRLMSLVLICGLALSCVNVKAIDDPQAEPGGGSENQSFEIFPINEDGENLNKANMPMYDGHISQPFYKASYKDFYRRYLGDIYAKFSKQIINGRRYKKKDTRIRKESCYDGACFWGEVKGDNLISYEKLSKAVGLPYDERHIPAIEDIALKYSDAKESDRLDKEEKAVGGIWLKFTDKKYKDKNGNIREFYIAKKPVLKNISWDDLYNVGVVYGLEHQEGEYNHSIVEINDKKYVVRLLRGMGNYKDDNIFHNCYHSEWNRTIIPTIKQYRYSNVYLSSGMLEDKLKDDNSGDYVSNDYKIQTASYNWIGDLTLGAYYDNYDNGKRKPVAGHHGRYNWVQEDSFGSGNIRGTGNNETGYNAAFHDILPIQIRSSQIGWRPVLELINE